MSVTSLLGLYEAPEKKRRRALKKSPLPAALGLGLYARAAVRVREWDRALENVRAVQEEQLLAIVRHAAGSEWGRAHDFASIRGYDDWTARVPVGDYDSFAPFIDRMKAGEAGVLVPEVVRHYGNSSGSSQHGRQKFLPIGETQIRWQILNGQDALFRYLVHARTVDFTGGYTLGLFPPPMMKEEGPSLITNNPALMSTRVPKVAQLLVLPQEHVKTIADYDTKLEAVAANCFDHDVRAISGTTCWFVLMFDKLLAEAKRRGHRYTTVREIWPNLEVLLGGGVSADPYLPVIRERVGGDITLVDTYNATEGGIYACSDHTGARGMRMIPDRGVFFEFVPLSERGKESPRRVPLWAVEPDELYSIVVTTTSGLYAYELGDLVRFASTRPLRIEFAGRLQGCLSTTQELTTHVEIERAVEHAVKQAGGTTVDFGAGADVGVFGTSKSRYVLFVEFAPGGAPRSNESFIHGFDAGLCDANRVYREHRKGDVAILAPELVVLPSGSSQRYLREVSRGNVQSKFPRIVSDERKAILRSFAEEQEVRA